MCYYIFYVGLLSFFRKLKGKDFPSLSLICKIRLLKYQISYNFYWKTQNKFFGTYRKNIFKISNVKACYKISNSIIYKCEYIYTFSIVYIVSGLSIFFKISIKMNFDGDKNI